MAINNLNPRRTIWYSTEEPSNKYDLWLCPSTVTETDEHGNIVKKCLYNLKIYECGEWKIINFCHCNGGDDPSHYIPVESLRIEPNPVSMKVGDGRLLSCIITPLNATNQGVTWSIQGSTTDRMIIKIDQNGYVTALNTGTATVIATSKDNSNIYNTAIVTVTQSSGGNTYTVTTIANPTNGGTVTGGGTYTENASCTVTATAKSGYTFSYWRIGTDTYLDSSKTFTVTNNISCTAYFVKNATTPTVRTIKVEDTTYNSTHCYGEVETSGNANISEMGFCYGKTHNPSITGDYVSIRGAGVKAFDKIIGGLDVNTIYYVRAYAKNSAGLIGYGGELSFTTLSNTIPTVTTKLVINENTNSAKGGGYVHSDGGQTVTERGICWSTSHNPTTSSAHLSDGSTGTGVYWIEMSNLNPDTTYYVRAYAINTNGIAYGAEVSFKTLELEELPDIPIIHYGQALGIKTADFLQLQDGDIMRYYYEGYTDTTTLTYSSDDWNGNNYYLVFFLIRNDYTIQEFPDSEFISGGIHQSLSWDYDGPRSIEIGPYNYNLYFVRRQFSSGDTFTINVVQ